MSGLTAFIVAFLFFAFAILAVWWVADKVLSV
jgi:hypothetical protein